MKRSTRDRTEGKLRAGKGRLVEKVGELTDDPDMEVRGESEKIAGKLQEVVGKVEKALGA